MKLVMTHDPEEFERRLEAVLERLRQIFDAQDRQEAERIKKRRDTKPRP